VAELAQMLVDLIDDEPRRQEMGKEGRTRVEQELAWDHQAPIYVDVYQTLIEGPQRLAATAGG
jgi:glycosyltransferase involved in cell wall biosynthesis